MKSFKRYSVIQKSNTFFCTTTVLTSISTLFCFALCAFALSLFEPINAEAQSQRSTLSLIRSIRCPSIIADSKTGLLMGNSGSSPRFRCFSSSADAQRAGYFDARAAMRKNFTGWYRLNLGRSVRNTCDSSPSRTGPVLFFQLRDSGAGLFGQFCPSFGTYTGYKEDSSMVISGEEDAAEDPSDSPCDDGLIRIQRFIRLTRSKVISTGLAADYKEVITCRSPSSGASVCSREYTGLAAKETHRIWPTVSRSIQDLGTGCSQALATCAGCHPGIDFGGLRP